MPREKFVKWRLQEEKEGYVPPQCNRRDNTGVLEDIRFISDQIMYDTLSEGKRNTVIINTQAIQREPQRVIDQGYKDRKIDRTAL